MNELQFSVDIATSKEKVWSTMWQDETFRDWASVIDPETYMVGELIEGNEVQFMSAQNGYGVTSLVAKVVPGEYLLLKHQADTKQSGAEQREDEWTGGEERYELSESNGVTTLTISFGVPPQQEGYFRAQYPKALRRIKELAE
jgi:uncharacterized protein YndB with AHSA1/START domain